MTPHDQARINALLQALRHYAHGDYWDTSYDDSGAPLSKFGYHVYRGHPTHDGFAVARAALDADDAARTEASTHAYYAAHAAEYVARWHASTVVAPLLDAFLADLPPGAKILDVGCGSGRDVLAMRGRGFAAVGIDACRELVAAANAASGTRGLFLTWDARTLPYQPATFDGVWCCAVLHHLVDPRPVLAEIAHVLKPGGLAFLSTSHGEGAYTDADGRYFRRTGLAEMAPQLETAGMALVRADVTGEGERRWLNVTARRL